jgi:hypothetical protein
MEAEAGATMSSFQKKSRFVPTLMKWPYSLSFILFLLPLITNAHVWEKKNIHQTRKDWLVSKTSLSVLLKVFVMSSR